MLPAVLRRRFLPALALGMCLLASLPLSAQYAAVSGYCENGKVQVTTSGVPSSIPPNGAYVQGSYPGCTVSIYYTGTANLVPGSDIFSDTQGTVAGNPFTASATNGFWQFYINQTLSATSGANSVFDIKLSGTLPSPVMLPYVAMANIASSPTLVNATLSSTTTNSGTIAGGAVNPATLDNVVHASQYSGADATAKISAACAALPSSGGVVDATGLTGSQVVDATTNIVAGCPATGNVSIVLSPSATYTCPVSPVSNNGCLDLSRGNISLDLNGASVVMPSGASGSTDYRPIVAEDASYLNIFGPGEVNGSAIPADGSRQHHGIFLDDCYMCRIREVKSYGNDGDGIEVHGGVNITNINFSSVSVSSDVVTVTTATTMPWSSGTQYGFVSGTDPWAVSGVWCNVNYQGTITITSGTTFTYATSCPNNSSVGSDGTLYYQNYQGETLATASGSQSHFLLSVAHPKIVPGTVVLTIGSNTATDVNGLGTLSGAAIGTTNSGNLDYGSGQVTLDFASAPSSGTVISISYDGGGGEGFSDSVWLEDNQTDQNVQAGIGIIMGRNIWDINQRCNNSGGFECFDIEPNGTGQWARNIHLVSPKFLGGGFNVTASGGGVDLYTGWDSIVDPHVVGGCNNLYRAPHSTISGGELSNSNCENPITIRSPFVTLDGTHIGPPASGVHLDTDAAAVVFGIMSSVDSMGYPANACGDVVENTVITQFPAENVINPLNCDNATIQGNHVYDLQNPSSIFTQTHAIGGTGNQVNVVGNTVIDDQASPTTTYAVDPGGANWSLSNNASWYVPTGGTQTPIPIKTADSTGGLQINPGNAGYWISDGTITISSATSGSYTFLQPYLAAPKCQATENSASPTSLIFGVTSSTTAVTVTLSTSGSGIFTFHCGASNN